MVVLDFLAMAGPCVKALPELIEKTSQFDKRCGFYRSKSGESRKMISTFLKKKKLQGLKLL